MTRQSSRKTKVAMSKRQCEIAAEAYAAHLLARCGYDVLVQYGAGQPKFDLVAVKAGPPMRTLHVSVKGGQTGGWMLATKEKDQSYEGSIEQWRDAQGSEIVFVLVEFLGVPLNAAPRAYIARAKDIADHLKTQSNGRGWGALRENSELHHPKARNKDKIPDEWEFTQERIDKI